MTKVILNVDKKRKSVYFDCMNHAGDSLVCAMASTLCGIVLLSCERAKLMPDRYESGHMTVNIPNAADWMLNMFDIVGDVFEQIAEQYPQFIKIY